MILGNIVNYVGISEQVEVDDSFPSAYAFFIQLDKTPDIIWQQNFFDEWKKSFFVLKRQVTLTGDRLRVVFLEDEEEAQLNFYRALIEAANRRVDEYNEDALRKKQREAKREQDRQTTIERLRHRLQILSEAQGATE
jgi:hypothetical protein